MTQTGYHFPKKTIRDLPLHDKTILLRADFNVPLSDSGEIMSDYRITQTLPTIRYLLERHCKVIIIAHLGRPGGKPNQAESLQPVADHLQTLLPDIKVNFVPSKIDDGARQACKLAKPGSIVVLENLRFSPKEEANDPEFAAQLQAVAQADYFVQDGFGVVHRAHASTEAITHLLPAVAGLLLEREVTTLERAMKHPEHPLVAVVGGAKIADKIDFIERLLLLADTVLIGGAMANTFLAYQGLPIGKSLAETDQEHHLERIYKLAKPNQLLLPVDVAVASEVTIDAERRECTVESVAQSDFILDLGPKTMQLFDEKLQQANTVIWNGTLGLAEYPQFATASADLAAHIANKQHQVASIVGGGDTADFVLDWLAQHPKAHFSHISTGGGASLELMSGLPLPGVVALLPA
jgi:3-phosphoglycerate kinase